MQDLAEDALRALRARDMMLVTAESCTGGMIAAALTDLPGASHVLERGYVTYSNESKIESLGVDPAIIAEHGAVSAQAAKAMAAGALAHSRAQIALSVTGIAGPGGGSEEKPVGLVYIGFACAAPGAGYVIEHHFKGDRAAIRTQTLEAALTHLLVFMESLPQ